MIRVRIVTFNLVAASAVVALIHCGDDDSVTATPDASTDTGTTGQTDAGFEDANDPASNIPVPTPRKWKPTVGTVNLQPQPIPDPDGGPSFDPGFTIPLILPTNASFDPARKPDAYIDSKSVGGIGLGCVAYKFSPANPLDPKGPGLTSGDMGSVTVSGFSGTGTYLAPPAEGNPVMKPISCNRNEMIPPDPDAGFAGIHDYACNVFGPLAPPEGGGPTFLSKDDTITVVATGGDDISPWIEKVKPSPNDNLVVKTNLWALTAADVDGSKDLVIEYECGGAPCGMAASVSVVIVSSNARTEDPPHPFYFPGDAPGDPFPTEFGLIDCLDILNTNGSKFVVPKEALAQIPASWNDLRVVVGTMNANIKQVDLQPLTVFAGFSRFGISRR
jgi:hypothetical protein